MSNRVMSFTFFGHVTELTLEQFTYGLADQFCCEACYSPDGERYLDTTWLCDDCYQEATLQLSRQHNYTVEWESDE